MPILKGIVFFLCLLIIETPLLFSEPQNPALDEIFTSTIHSGFISEPTIKKLLTYGIQKKYNIFDLLNETGNYLKARRLRISLWGSDLRKAAQGIDLGDDRAKTLVPLEKIVSMSWGSDGGTGNELEVFLSEEHSGFLELGDFYIQKDYGFRVLGDKKFEQAFGIRVKSGMMGFDLENIERVPDPNNAGSENYIAIFLKMFPKPKRWLINPLHYVGSDH